MAERSRATGPHAPRSHRRLRRWFFFRRTAIVVPIVVIALHVVVWDRMVEGYARIAEAISHLPYAPQVSRFTAHELDLLRARAAALWLRRRSD